jgi:hypothetical protein
MSMAAAATKFHGLDCALEGCELGENLGSITEDQDLTTTESRKTKAK